MALIQYSPIQVPDKNTQLIQSNIQKALTALQAPGGFPYTPGNSGSWATPGPTTLQEALDRMAALLKTLNSGNPIP